MLAANYSHTVVFFVGFAGGGWERFFFFFFGRLGGRAGTGEGLSR